jgi:hypothetical protein
VEEDVMPALYISGRRKEKDMTYSLTEMRTVVEKAITNAKLTPVELMAAVQALATISMAESSAHATASLVVIRQWCEENWRMNANAGRKRL